MENLSLDSIIIDTNLAEIYLRKNNNFDDMPLSGMTWLPNTKNDPDKRYQFEYDNNDKLANNPTPVCRIEKEQPRAYLGRKLAKTIEKNALLLSQLEYLVRKTDANDVKNNIKLISQHLQCCDASWITGVIKTVSILMNEKTPLYALGCVASSLYSEDLSITVEIVTTHKMAPICKLFTDFCAELGWIIPLIFVHDDEEYKTRRDNHTAYVEAGEFGCTGVVTESADIESALDLFINSSVTAPWKLQRIYVQESVYDEVKSALAWKCTRESVASCADAFATKGKIFLCDMLMTESGCGDAARVLVEAYRTAKELSGLLAQYPAPFLSVWASDAPLAHEVALAAPATRVWLNEYAAFDGPPLAALPVYHHMYPSITRLVDETSLKTVINVSSAWTALTKDERVDLVMNVLQDHLLSVPDDVDRVGKLQSSILNRPNDSFVSVNGARICFGVELPPLLDEFALIRFGGDKDLIKIINATIYGNTVVYWIKSYQEPIKCDIIQSLEKAGVPLWSADKLPTKPVEIKTPIKFNRLKVVSTNFGTIFAN